MGDLLSLPLGVQGADLSPDGIYRFRLWRIWNQEGDRLLWVMLNPSDADASDDDPTVRKCIGFAKRLGFGSIEIVNLYAFRTPSPKVLRKAIKERGEVYAIGPDNDAVILNACTRAKTVIAAWGPKPFALQRAARVREILRMHPNVLCLGRGRDDQPLHPLMLAYATPMQPL